MSEWPKKKDTAMEFRKPKDWESGWNYAIDQCREAIEGITEHELAMDMQKVDFDINDIVVLRGNKYQVISISAGVKLAATVKRLLEEKTK